MTSGGNRGLPETDRAHLSPAGEPGPRCLCGDVDILREIIRNGRGRKRLGACCQLGRATNPGVSSSLNVSDQKERSQLARGGKSDLEFHPQTIEALAANTYPGPGSRRPLHTPTWLCRIGVAPWLCPLPHPPRTRPFCEAWILYFKSPFFTL